MIRTFLSRVLNTVAPISPTPDLSFLDRCDARTSPADYLAAEIARVS